MPGGCWRLELTDALIGNEVVSCLYSFGEYDGYEFIFLNCIEERSKQYENWNDARGGGGSDSHRSRHRMCDFFRVLFRLENRF